MKLDHCVKVAAETLYPDNGWMQFYCALQLQMDLDDFVSAFHLEGMNKNHCLCVLLPAKFFGIHLY